MITQSKFGALKDGVEVTAYRLSAGAYSATILDYGGIIQSICVPNAHGGVTDVCLGYNSVEGYTSHGGYIGALIGRVGNRICRGKFTLNGVNYDVAINNGLNHLHGGNKGFDSYIE